MTDYVLENTAGILVCRPVSADEARKALEPWKTGFVRLLDGQRLVLRAEYSVPSTLEAA